MITIFHGWRRMMGLVTLLMACGFTILWLRSEYRKDFLSLVKYGDWHITMLSLESSIALMIVESNQPVDERLPKWGSAGIYGSELNAQGVNWLWRSCGFGHASPDSQKNCWVAPYWSIAAPLNLFSAFLLLSKPRVAKPQGEK